MASSEPEACPASSAPHRSDAELRELRLVLLGKTGSGKSSSGNTILGREAFHADISPVSITNQCQRESQVVFERRLVVIDTPGFFDTGLSPQDVTTELGRCILLSSPGPHMFLVVLQPGRFTQEEQQTLDWILATFGPDAFRHTMVLFTWGDQLRGKPIEEFLSKSKEISDFVGRCKGGCHVFDNFKSISDNRAQVSELLCKIDKTVEENGGSCYSNMMYQEAERAIQEAKERILEKQETGESQSAVAYTEKERTAEEDKMRREEEEARKKAERLFWSELLTAMGKGAAEGAGLMEDSGEETGKKKLMKGKMVKKATALAAKPLSLTSAAKVVGGAVREGSKVLYKHRKTFLH